MVRRNAAISSSICNPALALGRFCERHVFFLKYYSSITQCHFVFNPFGIFLRQYFIFVPSFH